MNPKRIFIILSLVFVLSIASGFYRDCLRRRSQRDRDFWEFYSFLPLGSSSS